MNRAYSLFDIRAVDQEKRIIEGIATTPKVARDGDILETQGIRFQLPIPFLYQHNSKTPMGNVVSAEVTEDGIKVRIQVAPKGTADFIDEAWRLIQAGVVRGLSIGWRTLKEIFDKSFGGFRIQESEWLELSAVPVPADTSATILSVRTADRETLAALGIKERTSVVRLHPQPAGVTAKPQGKAMTIAEQITGFENKRASIDGRQEELMDKAGKETRSLDATESEEYDRLDSELKDVDEHITRLRAREKTLAARATKVTEENTRTAERAVATRQGHTITVTSNAPKGVGVARMAMAMANGALTHSNPLDIAKRRWPDSPEVEMLVRAVIEAGDTTTSGWASQLLPAAQQLSGEFLDMLRALVVMGRIPGLREVPFNVSVPLQSGGGTYGYVGEGAPKPVTKPTYGSATLRFEKAAGIIVITEELARFAQPSAEVLVRDELLKGLTAFFDGVFVGADAAVSNVSPAGIRNGISATAASGTTAARFRYDMNIIIQNMITNSRDPSKLAVLMSSGIAMSLASMINTLGQNEFPSINATGGNYLGMPIVTSQALGTNIILIDPTDILLAEDPAISIDVSREASVEMSSTPIVGDTSPITGATLKSFWQNNLVGLRAEQFRTWKVARATAVEYISGAGYTPPTS